MGMALNPSLELTWREYAMPDASGAVQLARLPSLAADHFWALVQFPPNWRRIRPGHYSVDEDFLLLHGDLTINDQLWRAREHGFVPAHAWRGQTFSRHGCTACARFHGRPEWHAGPAAHAPTQASRHRPVWPTWPAVNLHGLGLAQVAFEQQGMTHGVLPSSTLTALQARGVAMDAFDLPTPRGDAKPALADDVPSGFHWARWPRMI